MNPLHIVHEVGKLAHHHRAIDISEDAVVVALCTSGRQQRLPCLVCIVRRPLLTSDPPAQDSQYVNKVKVKIWTLAIAPLTWVRLVISSALQSRKWQLIGMSQWCRSALCGHPLPVLTDNWTHSAASRHTIAPISHTRPSPRSRSYYSFPVPLRVGDWVGQSTE